ncbi:hypothetical protein OUZ56_002780 [Daphnia magna]|uniref:Uncharacterized protein n=1 Tax=Daphnia magna TaxID=35525 RepID=A0ABR0A6T6_9CRUS|nr:hypothetical protein OUZ56_002780 [Daphnia magna]
MVKSFCCLKSDVELRRLNSVSIFVIQFHFTEPVDFVIFSIVCPGCCKISIAHVSRPICFQVCTFSTSLSQV